MKIYVVLETDYEWTEAKAAFETKEKAEHYIAQLSPYARQSYHYPIRELELQ